jgi:hypothetical protein
LSGTRTLAKKKANTLPPRYEAFLDGTLTVEDLDDEELLKGQLRDKDGQFRGRPPLMIPRAFHVKLTQELLHRAEGKIREHFNEAMQVFIDVMNNPRVRPQDRLYAAQYVWERMAGKIPEKQVVEASVRKWEDVAEAVVVELIEDGEIEDAVIVDTPALPSSRRKAAS